MFSQRPIGDIDLDALINWIKRRPELRHLREEADKAKVDYRPGEATPRKRIRIDDDRILRSPATGLGGRVREIVWVPVRNMRGRSYATPTSDATVNATAKLMSLSTLWDFFCTLPLFKFGLAGPLGGMAWPGAVVLSFLILWASNVAGEKATDRHDANHARMATLALWAFLLLSLSKTAFSGVGIDLFIGSRAVASRYGEQLIEQKLSGDRQELARLEEGGPELKAAAAECDRLQQQLGQIDRNSNEKAFQTTYVLAYGSKAAEAANAGLTPQALISKYGSVGRVPGACSQQKLLRELNSENARDLREAIERKARASQAMPPLAFLQKEEPEIYAEHFRERGGELAWVNGTTAVAQATDQFWEQLLKGQFGLLGFSLFFLIVSIILTGVAALLIYQLSQNAAVKASYSPTLMDERDGRLQAYREAMKARKEGCGSMAWIPLSQRSAELRGALERWQSQRDSTTELEEQYNQQDFGLLSEAQLFERISPAVSAPVPATQATPASGRSEGEAFEVKSLRYLRNSAETAEDRRWAETLHDSMLLKLWLQHVTETGDTYYPPLAEDLFQSYQLQEDGHHS